MPPGFDISINNIALNIIENMIRPNSSGSFINNNPENNNPENNNPENNNPENNNPENNNPDSTRPFNMENMILLPLMADSISIKIRGGKELQSKINIAARLAPRKLNALLAETSLKVHEEAVKSIQGGNKSGRTYTRGNVSHKASAPGQAPATDRGRLVRSIKVDASFLKYAVGSHEDAPHGFWLEFGTSKMVTVY